MTSHVLRVYLKFFKSLCILVCINKSTKFTAVTSRDSPKASLTNHFILLFKSRLFNLHFKIKMKLEINLISSKKYPFMQSGISKHDVANVFHVNKIPTTNHLKYKIKKKVNQFFTTKKDKYPPFFKCYNIALCPCLKHCTMLPSYYAHYILKP